MRGQHKIQEPNVLLDLLMVVLESRPDLRVFMISTYEGQRTIETALTNGASKFLTKPVDLPQLKQDVMQVVAESGGD